MTVGLIALRRMDERGHAMVTRLAPEPLETSAVDVDDTAPVRRVAYMCGLFSISLAV
jgi:hypothetical protein